MKIKDLKAIAPLANFYEIPKGAKLLAIIHPDQAEEVCDALREYAQLVPFEGVILTLDQPGDVKFYEIK